MMREKVKELARTWIYRAIMLLFGIAAVMVMILVYWRVAPYDVLQIHGKIPVRPTTLNQGDALIQTFNYCKTMESTGIIERQLVSTTRVIILPTQRDEGHKFCGTIDVPLVLPNPMASDTYRVHYKITYDVNPVRSQEIEFYTEPFTVLGSPKQTQDVTPSDKVPEEDNPPTDQPTNGLSFFPPASSSGATQQAQPTAPQSQDDTQTNPPPETTSPSLLDSFSRFVKGVIDGVL